MLKMKSKTKSIILWNIFFAKLYIILAAVAYITSGRQLKIIVGIISVGIVFNILLVLFMLKRKSKQPMDDLMEFMLEKNKSG